MASFTVVRSQQSGRPRFAIAADETTAEYIFLPGSEMTGLNARRIERLLRARSRQSEITTDLDWIKLAMTNTGYFQFETPSEAEDLEDARSKAADALRRATDA